MLILGRKIDEEISIGRRIMLKVIHFDTDWVNLFLYSDMLFCLGVERHMNFEIRIKKGESIIIEDCIKIRYIRKKGRSVRLGFEAPLHINIQRR